MDTIFNAEPVHYTSRERWSWNNGFRRRWLALGAQQAAVINAARRGDFETVMEHVRSMGGVRGGVGIARSLIAAAARLAGDVPAYRIEERSGHRMVYTPHVSWVFKSGRQVGVIEWVPMFGVNARPAV